MQIVTVYDCGIRLVQTPVQTESGDTHFSDVHTYFLKGSPEASSEWSGNVVQEEPFGMGSPWDFIFKGLIDKYGVNLIGKTITLDIDDADGNIVKVR
jgi:hypothetical protein